MILIETNGNDVNWFTGGQLWFLSYMRLTTQFRSGFCAGSLHLLMSAAVALCWCKSSWVIQTHIFGRCCSVQLLTLMAPRCRGAMGPPLAATWGTLSFPPCEVCGIYHAALGHGKIWVFGFLQRGGWLAFGHNVRSN